MLPSDPLKQSHACLLNSLDRPQRRSVACEHILAAYKNEEPVYVRHSSAAARVAWWCHRLHFLKWTSKLGLLLLSCFERPVWCIRQQQADGVYPCDLPEYEGFRQTYLRVGQAFAIEATLLSIMFLLEAGQSFSGGWNYLKPRRNWCTWPLLAGAFIDMTIAVATPARVIRCAPFFRIAIAANYSYDVRRELALLTRVIPGILSLLLLTVLFLSFFSFCGLTLFHDIPLSSPYFGSFGQSMWSLLVLQTTSNSPDVLIAPYNAHRVSIVYFIIFIFLGTFFLRQLFTAAVYAEYTGREKLEQRSAFAMTEAHLNFAFDLLDFDNCGSLSREEIVCLVTELRKGHMLPLVKSREESAAAVFGALDRASENKLSRLDFMELCTVLKVQSHDEERNTWLRVHHPKLYYSLAFQRITSLVLHPWFQAGCDFVLLLMCVTAIWASVAALHTPVIPGTPHAHPYNDGKVSSVWNVAEIIFTVLFIVEASLKILVYGWRLYWRDHRHRLEFLTAVTSAVLVIVVYVPNSYDDSRWIRWTLMLRLLRFCRFLRLARMPPMLRMLSNILSVRHVRIFYRTFIMAVPNAMRLIKVTFCIVFFYAALGVQLFGGKITTDPASSYYAALKDSVYGTADYWALNLNDIPSGLVLMVQLLMVNNWMVFTEAFVAVGGPVAWFYFISFYLVGVVVGLNVLVSNVIDSFSHELEKDTLKVEYLDEVVASEEEAEAAEVPQVSRPPSAHREDGPGMLLTATSLTGSANDTGVESTGGVRMRKVRVHMHGFSRNGNSTRKAEQLLRIFSTASRPTARALELHRASTQPDKGDLPLPELLNILEGSHRRSPDIGRASAPALGGNAGPNAVKGGLGIPFSASSRQAEWSERMAWSEHGLRKAVQEDTCIEVAPGWQGGEEDPGRVAAARDEVNEDDSPGHPNQGQHNEPAVNEATVDEPTVDRPCPPDSPFRRQSECDH